jgi:hypothetical protein
MSSDALHFFTNNLTTSLPKDDIENPENSQASKTPEANQPQKRSRPRKPPKTHKYQKRQNCAAGTVDSSVASLQVTFL